eukprot:2304092-Rhodomonas_salina.1
MDSGGIGGYYFEPDYAVSHSAVGRQAAVQRARYLPTRVVLKLLFEYAAGTCSVDGTLCSVPRGVLGVGCTVGGNSKPYGPRTSRRGVRLREPYKTRRTELRIGLADRFGRRCAGVGTSTEPWYWHPAYGPTQSLRNIRRYNLRQRHTTCPLSTYAFATKCPVLKDAMVVPGTAPGCVRHGHVLRRCGGHGQDNAGVSRVDVVSEGVGVCRQVLKVPCCYQGIVVEQAGQYEISVEWLGVRGSEPPMHAMSGTIRGHVTALADTLSGTNLANATTREWIQVSTQTLIVHRFSCRATQKVFGTDVASFADRPLLVRSDNASMLKIEAQPRGAIP